MEGEKQESELLEKVLEYCIKKSYPCGASKNEKRVIRRKAERFEVTSDGEVLYKKKRSKVCK